MARSASKFCRIKRSLILTSALISGLTGSVYSLEPPLPQPTWAELTPSQRDALRPLAAEWDSIESYRRKKWLGIAQRYATMTPDERQRVQHRMKAWSKLSPSERQQARERYKNLKNAAPEKREDVALKWRAYKELPAEEKEKLKQQANKTQKLSTNSPSVTTPTTVAPTAPTPTVPPAKTPTSLPIKTEQK